MEIEKNLMIFFICEIMPFQLHHVGAFYIVIFSTSLLNCAIAVDLKIDCFWIFFVPFSRLFFYNICFRILMYLTIYEKLFNFCFYMGANVLKDFGKSLRTFCWLLSIDYLNNFLLENLAYCICISSFLVVPLV